MFGKNRSAAYAAPMLAVAFIALLPSQAKAVSCGTILAPTACSVTVTSLLGSFTYTASGFTLSGVAVTGGATTPTAGDFAISLTNPVGTQAQVHVERAGGPAVGQNQSVMFTVGYSMTVAPVGAGTAALQTNGFFSAMQLSSGNGSVGTTWSTPPGSCTLNDNGPIGCTVAFAGSTTVNASTAVVANGNTDGGAMWFFFNEVYDATFTPAPPQITKTFGAPSVLVGGTTTMTFTITNPNTAIPFNNIRFTDAVPVGIAVPGGTTADSGTCAPFTTAFSPATNTLNIDVNSLASGASCNIVFTVRGDVAGSYTNTTSAITAVAIGTQLTGLAASAPLRVNPLEAFLIRYAANLNVGESVVNFTNTGASSTDPGLSSGTFAQNGEICANVFAYSPDEQLVSCCSCNVTPNALNSLSVKVDLGTNTLTPIIPTSLVIKVVATQGGQACTASSAATVNTAPLQSGLAAWGSTIHALPVTPGTPGGTYGVTETPFLRGTISTAELSRMAQLCSFIRANGSGFGICKSCKVGGLGASAK